MQQPEISIHPLIGRLRFSVRRWIIFFDVKRFQYFAFFSEENKENFASLSYGCYSILDCD